MGDECQTLRNLLLHTRDGEWGEESQREGLSPVRIIRGTDFPGVRVGRLDNVPIRYLSPEKIQRKKLEPWDILIETAGGSKGHPTGRSLLVKPQILLAGRIPTVCASFARFLRVDTKKADPKYIFWFLQYLYSSGVLEKYQVQHTGIARFQFTSFASSQLISLPKSQIQLAIANILSTIDDKIELNGQMNETLEAMARALFKSWFVDFDPVHAKAAGRQPSGMDAETAKLFPSEFEDSELGPIPKGWKVGMLGDISSQVRDIVMPDELPSNTPYIGLEHMPQKSISLGSWGFASEAQSQKNRFLKGHILYGKLRPYFHKVGVAPVDGLCSTDIVVLKSVEDAYSSYCLGHVSSESFVAYTNAGSEGTRMPRTSWSQMAAYPLPIPPATIANSFREIVEQIVERLHLNVFEIQNLAKLRETLLPVLLSGDLPATKTQH